MRIRLVTSLREFDGLAPAWRDLTTQSGQTSPFVSHDWFACCWRTAGPNRRREAWIVEDNVGPTSILPFVHRRTRVRGLTVRMLQVLDSADTPFIAFPVAASVDTVVETVLAYLHDRRDWDIVSLRKLPADSAVLKALAAVLPGRFAWRVARTEKAPFLQISGSWESFFRGKTQRFRKTCRSIENRIRRDGELLVEEHREVDSDGPIFEEAMEVSRLSWKGSRSLAMATMQGMPRFFRELTRRASARGWLHLWILRLNGRAIATEYQIGADGCLQALRADFDSALGELSPGAYLNLAIIRALFERPAVQEYDMGLGLNEYKLRWATGLKDVVGLEIYAPTLYGRVLAAIETRLLPMARRWRDQLRTRCA